MTLRVPGRDLKSLRVAVEGCRRCPRLVAYRQRVAERRVRRFRDQEYWGRPVAGLGDPAARLLIVGLAPAAHGANRTGRMFTGDRSGDFLFAALYRAGFANQPESSHREDGLRLEDCYITAVVRCAPPENRPTPAEFDMCRLFLTEEIRLLPNVRVVVALGRIAFDAVLAVWGGSARALPIPRPRFSHGVEAKLSRSVTLLASYHPSQLNTQTGLLTVPMFARIFDRAGRLIGRATR